jgi:elongator complex protein 5
LLLRLCLQITSHPSQEHIPFNLSLTPAQAASRADVPVPYAHEGDEGQPSSSKTGGGGKILFEPGSEDDMDEDDPDEDLDF